MCGAGRNPTVPDARGLERRRPEAVAPVVDAADRCCSRAPSHRSRRAPPAATRTAGVFEQLAPQRQMETLDLPGRGRRPRRRQPVGDAVAAADLVEQHMAAAAEAISELLAVICQDLLRRAIALQRLRERKTDRAGGRALNDPGQHAIAGVIVLAGDDPPLAQLAG